ncbi:phage adaptor protein [Brucella sp. 22210]|uniref:phage adaptor protein n=1 Tax=Brucella sp. 22210 TaxID=3453892 RepID=UPI003F855960
MTVLSAAQDAIARLVGRRPAAVVSSTDEICVEVTSIAQEAAEDIAKAHDWQNLTEFYTLTADGTASAYPFPSDYDRMVQKTELYDPKTWCWGYEHITDYGQWIIYNNSGFGWISPGIWTIRKNQFHFMPTPAQGAQAVFAYVQNTIFTDANGNPKAKITADTDVFVLDERILTLAIIWKWLSLKRMDYQQEMDDYNIAISQAAARDKGARVIRKNNRFAPLNTYLAYPWPLGGN